jgi:hypothetical protein
MPPVPAFYALPATLDDVVNQTVASALELLDVRYLASSAGTAVRSRRTATDFARVAARSPSP